MEAFSHKKNGEHADGHKSLGHLRIRFFNPHQSRESEKSADYEHSHGNYRRAPKSAVKPGKIPLGSHDGNARRLHLKPGCRYSGQPAHDGPSHPHSPGIIRTEKIEDHRSEKGKSKVAAGPA